MNEVVSQPKAAHVPGASQQQQQKQTATIAAAAPTHAQIAQRAFDIYQKKGSVKGQCQQNWQQAEGELRRHPGHEASQSANQL